MMSPLPEVRVVGGEATHRVHDWEIGRLVDEFAQDVQVVLAQVLGLLEVSVTSLSQAPILDRERLLRRQELAVWSQLDLQSDPP